MPPVQPTGSGPRSTWQRRAVLRALAELPGFVSVRTLHAWLRAHGQDIGLTTVYRTLHAFANLGHVATTHDTTGRRLYRLQETREYGSYLVCRRCGYAVSINADVAEQWATAIAKRYDFTDIQSVVGFTGMCGACLSDHHMVAGQCL